MNTVDLFRAMLPPVSYDPNGKYISAELNAEAAIMDEVKRQLHECLHLSHHFTHP